MKGGGPSHMPGGPLTPRGGLGPPLPPHIIIGSMGPSQPRPPRGPVCHNPHVSPTCEPHETL